MILDTISDGNTGTRKENRTWRGKATPTMETGNWKHSFGFHQSWTGLSGGTAAQWVISKIHVWKWKISKTNRDEKDWGTSKVLK